MKVLVVGSGGREHAMCWKLKQSAKVDELYCAPGNPGIAKIAENIAIKVDDVEELANFAASNEIDLTVVGPEYPLTLGVVDVFQRRGLRVFGPNKEGAKLEGSKCYAKKIMEKAGIPTAAFEMFDDEKAALAWIEKKGVPIVIKADGLAAGKGVFVCQSLEEVKVALEKLFGEIGFSEILVEECLVGKEASFIAATDGKRVVPLASSHDYKRVGENDTGYNTGGMGSVSPTPHLSPEQEQWVMEKIMIPAVNTMAEAGNPYVGFLYAGLMIDEQDNIKVLEFNARLGDPEAQVILRRMASDFFELLYDLSDVEQSRSADIELAWNPRSAVCVVTAAEGYPGNVTKGDVITGIEEAECIPDCVVFNAGTTVDANGDLVSAGGRVLNVTVLGDDLSSARLNTYKAVEKISFRGMHYRRDI